jgi:O-antigen/teichoic acid export membrane protein
LTIGPTGIKTQRNKSRYRENQLSGLKIWIARGSLISLASAIEFSSRFVRTAILSRLLIPSEFGTAVAITVVIGTATLITDVAIDKFVMVRSDEARALAAAHLLSVLRGGLLALGLIVSAPYAAAFFGVPEASVSFSLVALITLIRSFEHFKITQVQRNHEYAPKALAQLLSQVSAVVVALPAAYILRDHRAIVVSFLTESIVYCIATHLLARVPYSIRPDRAEFYTCVSFGIPLLFNGIGLALYSQLDRMLVGHWFGVSTLATYAVILNMAVVPITLVHRTVGTMGLTYISSRMRNNSVLSDDYVALVFLWGALATTYTLFVAMTLDVLTPLVFGPHFSVSPLAQMSIMVMAFCQVARGAAISFLLATERTTTLSLLSLSGGFGLALAFVLVHWWPQFEVVLMGAAAGDLLSFALFYIASSYWLGSRRLAILKDTASALGVLIAIVVTFGLRPELTLGSRMTVLGVGLLAIVAQIAFGLRGDNAIKTLLLGARS